MVRLRNLLRLSSDSRRRSSGAPLTNDQRSAEVLEDRALLSTITVTSADDTTASDGQVTLREAIGAANSDISLDGSTAGSGNDTIVFDASLAGQTILLGGSELIVTSNITIDAGDSNIVIDGDSASRLFRLEIGHSLNLVGLTLTNGSTAGSGNILSPSTIPAEGIGGAIYSNAGQLTLRDTIVQNSFAGGTPFEGLSTGSDAYGGGIAAIGGSVSLVNSRLEGNTASAGVASIAERPVDGYGGGLYASDAIVSLRNSTVDSNVAGGPATTSTITTQNQGEGFGGGVAAIRSNVSVESSTISRNNSSDSGGGIYRDGGSTMTLSNTTISTNTTTDGGAIYQVSGTTAITFSTIFGNTASSSGGGINNSGNVTIGNSILAGNTALSGANVSNNDSDDIESTGYNIFGSMTGTTIAGDLLTTQIGVDASIVLDLSLLNNGGLTETHTLIANSPALNAALGEAAPTDQRGQSRPGFGAADIGAVEISETEARDAVGTLDTTLELHTTGNLYENWGGLGEKWMTSESGHWYFILPSGSLYRWDGTAATASGTLVANLDPIVHEAPDLLYNASAAKLDQDLGLHSDGNLYTNWAGAGEKWMRDANDEWYFILPSGDLYKWVQSPTASATGTLVASLESKFHADPTMLFDGYTISTDRWHNLQVGSSEFLNWGNRNEKWFRGAESQQYFILPGGDVYRWDGSANATGTFVISTDPDTYTDPSRLHTAVDNVFSDWIGA